MPIKDNDTKNIKNIQEKIKKIKLETDKESYDNIKWLTGC